MVLSLGRLAEPEAASCSLPACRVACLQNDQGLVGGGPGQFNGSDDVSAGAALSGWYSFMGAAPAPR